MGWGQLLGGAAGFVLSGFNPAGALAGAALGGGLDEATGGGQTGAAREAAQIANASSDRALALQQRMYDESIARQQPYYQAGVNALPGYLKGIAAGGDSLAGQLLQGGKCFVFDRGLPASESCRATVSRQRFQGVLQNPPGLLAHNNNPCLATM